MINNSCLVKMVFICGKPSYEITVLQNSTPIDIKPLMNKNPYWNAGKYRYNLKDVYIRSVFVRAKYIYIFLIS